jgi:phosphate-selective porin OprO and OprP
MSWQHLAPSRAWGRTLIVRTVLCLLAGVIATVAPARAQDSPTPRAFAPGWEQQVLPARAYQAPVPRTAPVTGDPIPDGTGKLPTDRAELQKLIDERIKAQAAKKPEPAGPQEAVVGADLGIRGIWNNGVWFQTPNKDFIFHIGGAGQLDLALYQASDRVQQPPPMGVGPISDGVNIRRGRLRAEGTVYEVVDFLMEMEFFNGVEAPVAPRPTATLTDFNTPGPTDFNFTIKKLPMIGNIRIGNMKEPFSFEHLSSYRYLEFMERSVIFDAFVPNTFNNGFNPGIMAFNNWGPDNRGTVWNGIFKATSNPYGFGFGRGGYQYAGRVTYLPVWENDGECLVHTGLGVVAGGLPNQGQIRLRARESVRNGPFPLLAQLANTGLLNASSQELVNVETAAVLGSWTFQAEYTANWLTDTTRAGNPTNLGTFFGSGYYVEALYFLTGERRTYNKQTATFNRVIPYEPFFLVPGHDGPLFGTGAWEAGIRYSWVDLSSASILGGVLHDVTFGLNWYLNPNAKLQWNYDVLTRGDTGQPSDTIQAFGMRMAFDF